MKFDLAIDANLELIETPIWDERVGRLYWTDLFSGDVHGYRPASGEDRVWKTGRMIGSAIPCSDPGKLLCAIEGGLHLLDLEKGELTFLVDPEQGNPDNRYNDTRVDAAGRVFMSSVSKLYGTAAYQPHMKGGFYMVDTDGSVKTIEAEINQYNAIVWNRDNTKMFVVDTFNQALIAYDYDLERGPVSAGRVVIRFVDQGMPDGMSIDSQDNLYICHWTGKISVWSPSYELLETIGFPVEYVCCGGFAGEDLKDFYVATSRFCYGPEERNANPGAGGMFKARSPIAGTPDHFYPC